MQAGDSGSQMASLAAALADELRVGFGEVLNQLEDLRLAEWSDQAPPPPSHPAASAVRGPLCPTAPGAT